MSHVLEVETRIEDLESLDSAVVELGGKLNRGQNQAKWWGNFVDDSTDWKSMFSDEEAQRIAGLPSAERKAIINEKMGSCDHAISFPGCDYEIGVRATDDGKFSLRYDSFDGNLELKIGTNAGRLVQHYGVHRAVKEAHRKKLRTKRVQLANGEIKLVVEGV